MKKLTFLEFWRNSTDLTCISSYKKWVGLLFKSKSLPLLAVAFLFFLSAFQTPDAGAPYTKIQIETFIREVFAGQADALVFKSSSSRMQLIESFLSRVAIQESPEYAGKKFKLLSTVRLQNKYNPNLKRDVVVDHNTFNPLKYNLPMASRSREIFRIDNTNCLIIIQPLK